MVQWHPLPFVRDSLQLNKRIKPRSFEYTRTFSPEISINANPWHEPHNAVVYVTSTSWSVYFLGRAGDTITDEMKRRKSCEMSFRWVSTDPNSSCLCLEIQHDAPQLYVFLLPLKCSEKEINWPKSSEWSYQGRLDLNLSAGTSGVGWDREQHLFSCSPGDTGGEDRGTPSPGAIPEGTGEAKPRGRQQTSALRCSSSLGPMRVGSSGTFPITAPCPESPSLRWPQKRDGGLKITPKCVSHARLNQLPCTVVFLRVVYFSMLMLTQHELFEMLVSQFQPQDTRKVKSNTEFSLI